MITYETYLKHGGKRSENMFVCLRCEYILMRICAGRIARYKDVMRHSGQRDSVETLSSAARDLSYYYNDYPILQRMALWGIREIAELNTNRLLREKLNQGKRIKYLFCY